MKVIDKLFFDHPREKKETYCEHMSQAFTIGFYLLTASYAIVVHGIIPGVDLFRSFGTTSEEFLTSIIGNIKR
jgi:hypothetical protein